MNERPTNEQILMQAAQGFLQRADLKGSEVDTYAKAFNFVQTIVEGENVVVPAEIFKRGLEAITELAELKKAEDGAPVDDDPAENEDTSNGDDMISQGGPLQEEVPAAELEAV